MTSREYVKGAISHRQADRVPYCIEFTSDAYQAMTSLMAGRSPEELIGNDVRTVHGPWWEWHELGDDWRTPDMPRSKAHVTGTGSYEEFARGLEGIRSQGDPYILATFYGSHFEKAHFARGIENFLADMAADPQWASRFLADIVDRNMVMLENILSLKEIDGVLLGSDWGTQTDLMISPQMWEDMIAPGEQREYDLIHAYGKDVWVHSCGRIEKIIPRLIEMGLDVLNPVQPEVMDISMLKARYGDKLTFWGGVSTQRTLPYGTPDQVKAEARAVREMMSRGGGYILGPAQHIQGDVPVDNILALLEVAREKIA
jgi:uroporphyrinogen decarboxylase